MRAPLPVAAVILGGFAPLAVSAFETAHAPLTKVALFAAAAIAAELWQRSGDELSADPVEERPFTVAIPVQLAAVVVVGPWAAAVVAAVAVLAVKRLHGSSFRQLAFRASVFAASSAAAGIGFELAQGRPGHLALPRDFIALLALGVAYWGMRILLLTVALPWDAVQPDGVVAVGETALGVLVALFAIRNAWSLVVLAPVLLLVDQAYGRLVTVRREVAGALETFANIVDERDPSTYRHSLRVADYVGQLATALGMPARDVARLRWAGRLHDLGKVAVDSTVLTKPGRLDDAEWAAVHRAPRLSARLLQRFHFAAQQAQAVEFHHERYDGSGYYGVEGKDLPLASHFLIIADSFDAMTTDRPFRARLTKEEALAEIERHSGTQFHPTIAKAFVAVQRGRSPADVLTHEELEELRAASTPYRLPHVPGARDLRERPELVAVLGLIVALLGAGLGRAPVIAAGAAIAAVGLGLRLLGRVRAERLVAQLRAAVDAPGTRGEVFERLAERLERAAGSGWAALLSWQEHGLGGVVELVRGTGGPSNPALTSWLVREVQTADEPVSAPGFELGTSGVVVALPLRRDNSALVGFIVLALPRRPRRHVDLALRACLGPLGLALADRPVEPARDEQAAFVLDAGGG
jgi:HD-GYP domain-containing protein (c-di-GMP phosphodiesterase class II)